MEINRDNDTGQVALDLLQDLNEKPKTPTSLEAIWQSGHYVTFGRESLHKIEQVTGKTTRPLSEGSIIENEEIDCGENNAKSILSALPPLDVLTFLYCYKVYTDKNVAKVSFLNVTRGEPEEYVSIDNFTKVAECIGMGDRHKIKKSILRIGTNRYEYRIQKPDGDEIQRIEFLDLIKKEKVTKTKIKGLEDGGSPDVVGCKYYVRVPEGILRETRKNYIYTDLAVLIQQVSRFKHRDIELRLSMFIGRVETTPRQGINLETLLDVADIKKHNGKANNIKKLIEALEDLKAKGVLKSLRYDKKTNKVFWERSLGSGFLNRQDYTKKKEITE